MVQLLLKNGASVTALDRNGNTPLHAAVKAEGNYRNEIIRCLLYHKSPISARNNDGMEPLHILVSAVQYQQEDLRIVASLVSAGASIHSKTEAGDAPLDLVLKDLDLKGNGTLEMVFVFLQWGADPTPHMPHSDTLLQAIFEKALVAQAKAQAEGISYPLPFDEIDVPCSEPGRKG